MSIIYIVLTVSYLVRVLLFDGSVGPFERHNALIYEFDDIIGHPDLFDFIRRGFGAYHVTKQNGKELWRVNDARMMLWRCPKCLSLWVSMLVNGVLFALGYTEFNILQIFSVAFCAAFLVILMRHFE